MAIYTFSEFTYNTDTRELISPVKSVYLRKKVADVLCYLIENKDRVVNKEELLQAIWIQADYRENSLLQSIREIRKLLGETSKAPKFIRTVHMKGYEWIYNDVEEVASKANIENDNDTASEKPLKKHTFKLIYTVPVIFILLIAVFTQYLFEPVENPPQESKEKIVVLPFKNDTGSENFQWLELGYSDMFIEGLGKITKASMVPTYITQGILAQNNVSIHTLDKNNISQIINELNAKLAITATISRDGNNLRFNYRIHYKNGEVISGSIKYPNLPSSLPSLVSQISNIIYKEKKLPTVDNSYFTNSDAEQDYAKGIQAMRGKGAHLAIKYFEASSLHEPNNNLVKLKLAETFYTLGDWQRSEKLYQQLLKDINNVDDPYLIIGTYNGLASLMIQKNQYHKANHLIEEGLIIANKVQLPYKEAELLRTKSDLMRHTGKSKEHQLLLLQADKLSQPYKSLQNEADSLYYLGSPSNKHLEIDPDINLRRNKEKLSQALNYYQQLGDQTGIGRTNLAIGQNYYFDIPTRINALNKAQEIFKNTGNLIELIDTLNYHGYFYIQLHKGQWSYKYLAEAQHLLNQINAPKKLQINSFLSAFASLDQGIDRGNGINVKALQQAIKGFNETINDFAKIKSGSTTADSYYLLGWAYSELEQHEKALGYINNAIKRYQKLGYVDSVKYANTSKAEELLHLGQWQEAVNVAEKAKPSYLLYLYKAKAYYELGNHRYAIETLQLTKQKYKEKWTNNDENTLSLYENSLIDNTKTPLNPIKSSHLVYCESLWNQEGIEKAVLKLNNPVKSIPIT
ncbi:hypothetical protein tinsulaeT_32590 [Thalassotalea insulae]|uniref:OmpR/PhoB-type domain-containing protein n=1 Tax=Thalassotalea insulae TaxID=2056778 RepID=A0ABQ6GW65_9GAMM|nr:winged helix-turn-helix domain-containing protein [Thalassotalea insulae]GLX79919.1 hypothetical protein tinsulaeT_32590 [Thalassotalea insulae]